MLCLHLFFPYTLRYEGDLAKPVKVRSLRSQSLEMAVEGSTDLKQAEGSKQHTALVAAPFLN